MIYLFIANLSRCLCEWAERRGDANERHVIDLMRASWVQK